MTKLILSIAEEADRELVLALASRLNLPVEEVGNSFDEVDFWEIVALLDPDKEAGISESVAQLASRTEPDILAFADILAQKLFALDQMIYAKNLAPEDAWGAEGHFSGDHFLDARAYVIAKGRSYYQQVLRDPSRMPKGRIFEDILYLPEQAWTKKTGKPYDHLPATNYFTFSNPAGWPQTLTQALKID
ncbi:MAG: DUF4240 domain-containing protein [Bacteroidota bacterium]